MKILEKTAQRTHLTIPDDLLLAQINTGQKKLEINLTELDNTIALEFSSGQLALLLGNLTEPAEFTATKPLLGPAILRLSYDAGGVEAGEDIFLFASTSPWRPLSASPQDGAFTMEITRPVKYLLSAVG